MAEIRSAVLGKSGVLPDQVLYDLKKQLGYDSKLTGFIRAIQSNQQMPSSVSYATSRKGLASRAAGEAWALLKTFDVLAYGSLNAARGIHSPAGTILANAEDFTMHVAQSDTVWADLDAITLAVQTGGTMDGALVAWGALAIIEDIAIR